MTDLITALGQKITERWLAAIVLPGLLYTAVTTAAFITGDTHTFDPAYLTAHLNTWWQQISAAAPAGTALVLAGVLAAATLSGLAAAALADNVVHRAWTARGPRRFLLRRRANTKKTWADRTPTPPTRYLPQRATAVGERFRLIGERVHAQYGLSTLDAWPRIWMLAGPDNRTLITAAHQRYLTDTQLAAWSLLYLPWAWHWWPAALITIAGTAIAYHRARTSSTTLATLIEATIDTHQHDLAASLGVDLPENRVTPTEGNQINNILNKRA